MPQGYLEMITFSAWHHGQRKVKRSSDRVFNTVGQDGMRKWMNKQIIQVVTTGEKEMEGEETERYISDI